MIKLGVNSVLFSDFDFATAARQIALAGYDGIEIAAIKGMCEHLVLDNWQEQANEIKSIVEENELEILSMEVASLDEDRIKLAVEAAEGIGIPVINVGSGGKTGNEEDLKESIQMLEKLSELANSHGVTLCVKAHVGAAIYNTPTTLRAMEEIKSEGFGIDMDPSHIYRGNENPEEELPKVLDRVKHIHIRDCQGPAEEVYHEQHNITGVGPGDITQQTPGRGDIDLYKYCQAMVDGNYSGPVCLEVIGANNHSLADVSIVAAESYGYLNAILKHLGAR